MAKKTKKLKRVRGDIVKIDLGDGWFAFAQVLTAPLFAFFDLRVRDIPPLEQIARAPIAFKIWVMDYAVTDGDWPVIGRASVITDESPWLFKRDALTKRLVITKTGDKEKPASLEECLKLECAAVWEPEHVVDRLRDHFAGRPNKWVESLRAR